MIHQKKKNKEDKPLPSKYKTIERTRFRGDLHVSSIKEGILNG